MNETQHRLALPQGTRIGDFEFHRVLGHGGFGITYLGWNHALDIPVAIKEYLPADLATRERDLSVVPQSSQAAADFQWGLDRFIDEARILARFQHPNIVRVHHFFQANRTAYIVMEYAEGETLSAYLNRKGVLTEAELKAILHPILDGLEEVHQADFLHRDIKPGNIIIRDKDESPVLIDFGAARQAIGAKSRSVTSIVTPGYAPIEQYSSRGDQGPWTDIYALGGVCYRALTDDVPDDATDRVRRDPLIPVSDRCRGQASHEFLAAIDHALQVDEDARPQSVSAWRDALKGAAQSESVEESVKAFEESPAEIAVSDSGHSPFDDARRLYRSFRWHWIFLSVAIPLGLIHEGFIFYAAVVALGFGCDVLYKLWSLIPADKARTTPGKAVGFLFIPLFNFYWNFVAIHGLAKALNAEIGQKSYQTKISTFLSLSFCWLPWIELLLIIINTNDIDVVANILVTRGIIQGLWLIMLHAPTRAICLMSIGIIQGLVWLIMLRQMKNVGMRILEKDQ